MKEKTGKHSTLKRVRRGALIVRAKSCSLEWIELIIKVLGESIARQRALDNVRCHHCLFYLIKIWFQCFFTETLGVWKHSDSFRLAQTRLYCTCNTSSPTMFIDKQRSSINQPECAVIESSCFSEKGCYETAKREGSVLVRVYIELFGTICVCVCSSYCSLFVKVQTWSASKIECCLAFGQLRSLDCTKPKAELNVLFAAARSEI